MGDIAYASNSATRFDFHNALFKESLAASRSNNRFTFRVDYCDASFDLI